MAPSTVCNTFVRPDSTDFMLFYNMLKIILAR